MTAVASGSGKAFERLAAHIYAELSPDARSTSARRGGERNGANPDAGPPRRLDWGSLRPVDERCQVVGGVVVRGGQSCRAVARP